MFGHKIPRGLFESVREIGECYIDQQGGKPVQSSEIGPNTVAICKALPDNNVQVISETDRARMNSEMLPMVYAGLDIEISEAFVPDRFFENHEYANRPFIHGIFDCYTLLRDYYKREFNIWLPTNIQRTFGWWTQGEDLYTGGASMYGFSSVQSLRTHDIIIMKFGAVPSHGAIYLGGNMILHHLAGRFSCVEELSSEYRRVMSVVYRHESMQT